MSTVGIGLRPIAAAERSLSDLAYNQILAAVLDGGFKPGDRLIMDRLADDLEISRTPVRDALQRMQGDGLLEAAPKGYVIRTLTAEDVAAMYEARVPVESFAARIVAGIAEEARESILTALDGFAGLAEAAPSESFLTNRAFHRSIVSATRNTVLVDCFDAIWGRGLAVISFAETYRSGDNIEESDEHLRLFREVMSGDPDRAEAETIAHIRRGAASV
ncbi:MAG: GntR family transcriptional regulator [Acidimicrobiia bacterium]|nr:GntR family transcriptional regulator [Actinomycetota bacterium]MBL6924587.1 GntR family transcriptional regulator [Acidimicrobiia bacterium]